MPTPVDLDPADDPVLARLRAARPETPAPDLDPDSPANQAILAAIVGGHPRRTTRRPARRVARRVAAVAAAVAATTAVLVALPDGPAQPSAAAVARRAAAASPAALDHARATVTVSPTGGGPAAGGLVYHYRFSGDDMAVTAPDPGGPSGRPLGTETRVVGGLRYWRLLADQNAPWLHLAGPTPPALDWGGDPRTLLAALAPTAHFELAGHAKIDGVTVRHLRATTPGRVDTGPLRSEMARMMLPGAARLTSLDVWVDRHDVVRGLNLGVRSSDRIVVNDHGTVERTAVTMEFMLVVRFHDPGEPTPILPPARTCTVTPAPRPHRLLDLCGHVVPDGGVVLPAPPPPR